MFSFCWHKWSAWGKLHTSGELRKGLQFSKCEKCNAVRQKIFKVKQGILITAVNKEFFNRQ